MIRITLKIEGMMCAHCEAHMTKAIEESCKVKKVTSSRTEKQCVILTEDDIADDVLQAVTAKTGYKLLGVERTQAEKKGLFSLFSKK